MRRAIACAMGVAAACSPTLGQECRAWLPAPDTKPHPEPELTARTGMTGCPYQPTLYVQRNDDGEMETWSWDGTQWRFRLVGGFPARDRFKLISNGSFPILLGGHAPPESPPADYNDIWAWDGAAWVQIKPVTPIALVQTGGNQSFAYDRVRRRYVTFYTWEVWEWRSGWTDWQRQAAAHPGPNGVTAAFWDPVSEGVIALSSTDLGYAAPFKTWRWDGDWRLLTDTGPGVRGRPLIAFDDRTRRTVLSGGDVDGGPAQLKDTWEWDGAAWSRASSHTMMPNSAEIAFDWTTQRVMAYGNNEAKVWTWDHPVEQPVFLAQPEGGSFRAGTNVQLSVRISDTVIARYSWRKNGNVLSSGFQGQGTPTLTLAPVQTGSQGTYDVVVETPCGMIVSEPAVVTVWYCVADFNRDAQIDSRDVTFFNIAWRAGSSSADIDGSGGTPDDVDVNLFFSHYQAGC